MNFFYGRENNPNGKFTLTPSISLNRLEHALGLSQVDAELVPVLFQ